MKTINYMWRRINQHADAVYMVALILCAVVIAVGIWQVVVR